MQCNFCGWVYTGIALQQDSKKDLKHSHCQNCFADYTEFSTVPEGTVINKNRFKPEYRILVEDLN